MEELESFDALSEYDKAVVRAVWVPVQLAAGAKELQERLVLGELIRGNSIDRRGKLLERGSVVIGGYVRLGCEFGEALLNAFPASRGTGEERLLEYGTEEQVARRAACTFIEGPKLMPARMSQTASSEGRWRARQNGW